MSDIVISSLEDNEALADGQYLIIEQPTAGGDRLEKKLNINDVIPEPIIYDISSANQNPILPEVNGSLQEVLIFWSGGDGTYTLTLGVTSGETVGGITASTWTGEGEGLIGVVSDGTNWNVVNYYDSGEFSSIRWIKEINGDLFFSGRDSISPAAVSEISASITLPITMNDYTVLIGTATLEALVNSVPWFLYISIGTSSTGATFSFADRDGTARTDTVDFNWSIQQKWR